MTSEGTILVTGGAGYIGSHTVSLFHRLGMKVLVLDNLDYGHRSAVPAGVELVVGDVGDEEVIESLFTSNNIRAVIHFAAYAYVGESVSNPYKYYQNNVARPLVLLNKMVEHGCLSFVFSSTCATFGNPQYIPLDEKHPQVPISPYGKSKWMLEHILKDFETAHGMKYAFLRYFNAAGAAEDGTIGEDHDPETHLIPLILDAILGLRPPLKVFGGDYPTPDGTAIRDYVHVSDLAQAHLQAIQYLEKEGGSIACNLGTGKGFSVLEAIRAAEEVTGMPVPHEIVDRRPGDPAELIADPRFAKEALKWEPEYTDLKKIIRTAWHWMSGENQGKFKD